MVCLKHERVNDPRSRYTKSFDVCLPKKGGCEGHLHSAAQDVLFWSGALIVCLLFTYFPLAHLRDELAAIVFTFWR